MSKLKKIADKLVQAGSGGSLESFHLDPKDFLSVREGQKSAATELTQEVVRLEAASEVLNRSEAFADAEGRMTNVVSPVVIPKSTRSFLWLVPAVLLAMAGAIGGTVLDAVFGWPYWLLFAAFVGFKLWQSSYVMIPDGCQALITKFGKLEETVGPGRTWLFDPRKKVGYIVNTTKEFPYNAPIREAPTAGRVSASVDLFLQFRIEDPETFIFTLGGVNGFAEKLGNAVSEVTRSLIYEQKAAAIYDLVGESTEPMLATLNRQFLPAVRLVNANITHAEPSSQEYRMDLAAAEIVKVAKDAYTYEYELQLRKQQDEGDLAKELAGLEETLSEIRADVARYQAQIDTAREKEANRANAHARQMMVEAETEAKANAALLEAQALDIRAVSSAEFPEILEHRFRQKVLDSVEQVAPRLPRMVSIGAAGDAAVDFSKVARQMLGIADDASLFGVEEIERIRERGDEIAARIGERGARIAALRAPEPPPPGGTTGAAPSDLSQSDVPPSGVVPQAAPAVEVTEGGAS